MQRIAIFGATSAIALGAARILAQRGDSLFLVARDTKKLDVVATDLRARGASAVYTAVADLSETYQHRGLIDSALSSLGGLDVVFIAYGTLPDQKACEQDFKLAHQEIQTNFLSVASLSHLAASYFEGVSKGTIAVIGSVAGDRGRQSNYVYGSAKGGLSIFLQGLRNRLAKSGVKVITLKPGFVDTPMTAHIKKGPLFATSAAVGGSIVKAIDTGRDVVYVPCFWLPIMLVIKSIPETIFKRLKL